ncbi:hypothetical protein SprV_0802582500 [Sparganum proliferum]
MGVISCLRLLLLCTICAASFCDGEPSVAVGKLSEAKNVGVYSGESIRATAFEAIGQSYGIVVTMNPPDILTAKFKAFAFRQEGNRKSCTMSLVENKLSCVISQLQPNSTYLVALEACTQDEICVAYGNNLSIRTRPGVPRYVFVANRTRSAFSVSWYRSLEDPNGKYLYKMRAVEVDGNHAHTCDQLSAGPFLSCQLSNLKSGRTFEVSVSACISEEYCGDYTSPVIAETLPNPPCNQSINQAYVNGLDIGFDVEKEEKNTGLYAYFATLEPVGGFESYVRGCHFFPPITQTLCRVGELVPATKYNFRVFGCNRDSLLCSEGTPVVVETGTPEMDVLYSSGLDYHRIFVTWRTTLKVTDDGADEFEVRYDNFGGSNGKWRVAVGEREYNHTFSGLESSDAYKFNLRACKGENCTKFPSNNAKSSFKGAESVQVTKITQTTAVVSWVQPNNLMERVGFTVVYAMPVDKTLAQQQCVGTDLKECTLQHLQPDTKYTIVTKSCSNAGTCSFLSNNKSIVTAKPYTLNTPSDVQAVNVKTTSFSLTWTSPPADTYKSFEYRVSLKAPYNPEIPERKVVCETTEVDGKVICPIENLYTDISYSVRLSACATADLCSAPTEPTTIKTEVKEPYVLKAKSVEPLWALVSWSNNQTKTNAEFRVLVDSSTTAACTAAVTAGEHTCQVKGLLPSTSYSVKLTACQSGTSICEDLYNLPIETANGGSIYETLNTVGRDIKLARETPEDPTSQLMIRVSYSKLAVRTIGNLRYVSAVITPADWGSQRQGPTWSSSTTLSDPVGGTYVNPTQGSWEVRLPLPQAQVNMMLPDENVLLGSGVGNMADNHNYDGRLTSGTAFMVQLRVYTDLGYGTTAPTKMYTEDMRPDGGLITVSVILAVLCVLLIVLVTILFQIKRKEKHTQVKPNKVEKFDEVYEGL